MAKKKPESSVLSVKFERSDYRIIQKAARAERISTGMFVRRSALSEARRLGHAPGLHVGQPYTVSAAAKSDGVAQ